MNVGAATELRARLGENSTLAARAALRHGPGESELRNVIYTSCPICETGDRPPTWSLRARRAIQDNESRTISYQSAVLEIAGLPVLYLPYFAHPDPTVERATGFLPPDIGSNDRLGDFYEQPYHWAISPIAGSHRQRPRARQRQAAASGWNIVSGSGRARSNIDTTLTEERLFNSDGELFGESQLRSSVFARGLFRVSEDWDWGFGVERVYDDQYLRRYEIDGAGERRGPYIGQDTRLISQLYGIGQDKNFYSSLSFVGFQDLRNRRPGRSDDDAGHPAVCGNRTRAARPIARRTDPIADQHRIARAR